MAEKQIVILPGDGIGPEVTRVSERVLEELGSNFGHEFSFQHHLIGHAAIEKTGNPLPDRTLDACRKADAILMGAVGHPSYDNNPALSVRPEQGLLKIRKSLGLFANIRPITLFDALLEASSIKPEVLKGADILFFRELTSGIYFGSPRERKEGGQAALDTMYYHRNEVQRIAKMAFEAAAKRRKKLCSVDKANVLESSRLWRETVQEMAADYPAVEVTHMFVDNAAMQLIRDPRQFDVVLTGNMFGDILTDEASQIAGSMGMLASASVGADVGLYEPIHGSAPDIAGKGIANPLASVLSAALMLELSFQWMEEREAIIQAVTRFLNEGWRTPDLAGKDTPPEKILHTEDTGERLIRYLKGD